MGAMRTCAHCNISKSEGEYYKSTPYVCKVCHNARTKKRHAEKPELRREANWRNKYGIIGMTMERYEAMYESQVGLCAVCGRAEKAGRLLAVDHNHRSGAIRGLLCTKCNTTLGWIEKHPQIITYLLEEGRI